MNRSTRSPLLPFSVFLVLRFTKCVKFYRIFYRVLKTHCCCPVLSNLFRIADYLALKIHLPRPASIEDIHCLNLVQSFCSKIFLNLILPMPVENLTLIVGKKCTICIPLRTASVDATDHRLETTAVYPITNDSIFLHCTPHCKQTWRWFRCLTMESYSLGVMTQIPLRHSFHPGSVHH